MDKTPILVHFVFQLKIQKNEIEGIALVVGLIRIE